MGLSPEQIYNCDETALYYKILPDRTLATKNDTEKRKGHKLIKDRLTILLCTNWAGTHKLKPLCIGKYQSPRCLHHVNRDNMPVIYANTKKEWMTASVFQDWFSKTFVPAVRKYQRENNIARKAVLLLDNCPAYPPADTIKFADGSITSYYLPKNTTSMIQPLDQGIIANFKLKYRQDLVQGVIEDGSDIPSFLKKVTIKDAFYHAATAWDNVLPTTIYRCFNKGLGGQDNPTPAETEPTETSEDSDFNGFSTADIKTAQSKLASYLITTPCLRTLFDEWSRVDDECPVAAELTTELNASDTDSSGDEDVNNVPSSDSQATVIDDKSTYTCQSLSDTLDAVIQCYESADPGLIDNINLKILQLKSIKRDMKKFEAASSKQKSIKDYFK